MLIALCPGPAGLKRPRGVNARGAGGRVRFAGQRTTYAPMTLPGPSRKIIVVPIEVPARPKPQRDPEPAPPSEPAPEREPARPAETPERQPEPVP
jgi:hypothetical protein